MDRKRIDPERKQYSIVLLGDFNPGMFQPEWFCRHNVISEEDADFAKDQNSHTPLIVTPQITFFRTPQMTIQVETNRFEAKADKEPLVTIVDFVTKTFENLGGYKITAFGLNYTAHYRIGSLEELHKIGDILAPKECWEDFLEGEVSGNNRKSGLASIQMKKVKEGSDGYILFALQPSPTVTNGLLLSCNDHNDIPNEDQTSEIVIEMISKNYIEAYNKMESMQKRLLERVCY